MILIGRILPVGSQITATFERKLLSVTRIDVGAEGVKTPEVPKK
jgi:hypothetical protein